mmetsp:Transcript_4281/g.9994  ORF Transcript_4281/g.9994 Transcript_4281/m.9994 type:complete len:377 (+) Transcript_4281:64-1194(+)|eukprot:CAMPEP_0113621734 /NCGR_PEP_ID=MMETSP0017_2-20120614/11118_1 /TAXON_ID=2856 /ORGANISM="Cylindrotheca closterium" /LENGTH=376 /DNA_ID=CAMNT_0000531509 /DNA_START=72 /DNA_END=1202 /DNA_ORIENTATION=+ /assembly_acc=CAM_ASM_000147
MNRILLIALLALSSCVSTVTGNQRKFMRLAKCFNDTTYPSSAETITCLGNVSTCFDETTVDTVKTCIQDGIDEAIANATSDGTRFLAGHNAGGGGGGFKNRTGLGGFGGNGTGFGSGGFRPKNKGKLGKLAGIVMGCLEEHKECIKEEVRAFINNKLPACVNTTAVALGECYMTNAETCASSCSEADIPSSNPFEGVASSNIKACQGFQNRIMDPSCAIVDCCEECQADFDALMTCIGQDLLKLKPEPCELTCPTASTRRVLEERKQYVMRKLAGHLPAARWTFATAPDAATVADECAIYLDTEEETLTADAVTEKILDGEFIGCVADVAMLVAEEQKEYTANPFPIGGGDGTSASSHVMAFTGLATVLLGLVGFM